MKRTFLAGLGIAAFAVACLMAADPVPAAAPPDRDAIRREKLFGEAAATPGIAWRSSGLGIRIISPGSGAVPHFDDVVRVHYTGRLRDGTVFDDSRKRGKPADLELRRLIPGWSAAMTTLKTGTRAEIFIPPSLGYGAMKLPAIPANSGLIFDVELLAINPPENGN